MFERLRRLDKHEQAARALYAAIVERARAPVFYLRYRVPDNIDGRFDLLVLHCWLVQEALKPLGEAGREVGTHLATVAFVAFEGALRDLGVGDLGLSRRIKAMANAFFGRLGAYEAAESEAALAQALLRNLYRGEQESLAEAGAMAAYAVALRGLLARPEGATRLLSGILDFGPLPEATP